jgi:quercetin dioxygenase-like cupin family protein
MTHFPRQILNLPKYQGRFEAFKLAAQGCEVLFASYPAGSEIEAHTHDTDNIGMITQGELILTMDGQTERFGVGDWYHVPAGAEHAARFEVETAEIEFWFVAE